MATNKSATVENVPTSEPTSTDVNQEQSSSNNQQPLPLPEPPKETDTQQLDVSSGQGLKLDKLGPMVVNRDGTLSRIANWEHMTEIERRNTLRILGKRNQLRLDGLKNESEGEQQ
jgi:guanyl-specific ribonuclease Sa